MNKIESCRRNILVTGSSRGIGLAIAEKFSSIGNKVAINSKDQYSLETLSKENSNFFAVPGDVRSTRQAKEIVEKVIKKFGKLDTVICNVGSGKSVSPGLEKFDDWQEMFLINFFSTTNIIEASKNYLSESKGNIVCISSICGIEFIKGAPVTYSVSKAALNAYIKNIARPLGREGIRINGIAPGNIFFKNSVWDKKIKQDKYNVENFLKDNVSLNTLGDTEDIANLAIYLASPLAKFITGSIFRVDGGQVRS